ncbi:ABC transporter substrate-binding protein [Microbacterium sp. KSW4-11]|uniref:ABC transporter substrate-binding protein n=1 Tax=Microbacterium gawkjiense TaxID=3067309 RepID=A0ABU3GA27_9MICO|nr:ABC transporter substrate-binding protein [Microbacterium sp. KSW4-11]MDT3316385.1 ABC transporter substrate-binding protein [Microbacterium sp. KSW4-11]
MTTVIATSGLFLAMLTGCAGADEGGTAGDKPTLTIVTPNPPQSLDPSLSSGGQESVYPATAYQGLLHAVGNGEVEPGLASDYEWVGDSNTQLKLTLRPNLKFSDGEVLDSAAVKTWIEHFQQQGGNHAYAAAPIESVDTPDDTTVVLNLNAPTPQMPADLTEYTGLGAIGSPAAIDAGDNFGQQTFGAGPFMLSADGTVEGSTYTYVPNPYYYDPDAIDFGKVVIKVISDASTAFASVQSGQVDVTYGDAANMQAAEGAGLLQAAFPVNVAGMWTSDPDGTIIPAFADVRVRQALQYAVDRDAIAAAAAPGSGTATVQAVTAGSLGYDETLEETYPYDPARAKELLSEAGYGDGFDFTLVAAPGTDHSVIAQAIADQLAKVGVNVTLRTPATFTEFVQDILSGEYAAIVIGLGLIGMPTTMDNLYDIPGLVNWRGSAYPELVEMAASAAALSSKGADAAWREVNAAAVDAAYQMPIATTSSVYYWRDTVDGVADSYLLNPAYLTSAK